MDKKSRKILGILAICALVVLLIAFAATTGLSRTNLKDYREVVDDNERQVTFLHHGEEILTVLVRAMPGAFTGNSTFPMMVVLTHPDDVRIDSLTVSIHPPGTGTALPYGDIFLKTLEGNPTPMISYHTDTEAGKTISVLDIPDVGPQGRGSLRFDYLIHPFMEAEHPDVFIISISAKLSGTGDRWNKYVVFHPVAVEVTR
ncbi:hypothetical protein AZH53_00595 [Methanomicrobiaceae archaeon CYW5]|uniref:hypothetical protein n=1 Tax=Methanovulcanius yangii TaxID=1789227 RepID=UPI0029CA586E|nr:hypothetical protein [Methanovulcanius yangii]MBT8506928.1 hypothetical protein [Methanovulcanius yangii]